MLLVDFYKIPIAASLAAVATLLAGSVAASLLRPRPEPLPRPVAAAAGE